MNKRNYQRELDQLLAEPRFHTEGHADLKEPGSRPVLFLHCCCAPCSSYVLEYLSGYFELVLFFYNPNITEDDEYEKRKAELIRLVGEHSYPGRIRFADAEHDRELFFEKVKGLEGEPEGGNRCFVCYEMRLRRTAEMAVKAGADYFCTTLSISPHKNAEKLMEIGQKLAGEYGIAYLPSDFKKKGGYKRSIELSREYGLYRQNFCGCIYSRKEAQKTEKQMKKKTEEKMVRRGILYLLCLCLFLFTACSFSGAGDRGAEKGSGAQESAVQNGADPRDKKESVELFAMNTVVTLTVYGEKASELLDEAKSMIYRYENMFSVNVENSDIDRLNRAGGEPVKVSADTYEIIRKGMEISAHTDGLFDISVYPLVRAWGFTTDEYRIPDEDERARLLETVDYTKIQLGENDTVTLLADMQIDLGGIAKGYVSQKLVDLFRDRKAEAAVISLGGNVQTYGKKTDGTLFTVGITDPADGSGIYGTIEVEETAVVTSGSYQRYFERDGVIYHHIIDKRTGAPAQTDLASVTVLSGDGTSADALATALFMMGKERAIAFDRENEDIKCILIDKNNQVWTSEGLTMN